MMWLAIPLLTIVLWIFYLAYSALKFHWNTLRLEVKIVGALVVLIGGIVDIGFNWTIGLVLGVGREFTFSQKCARLRKGDMGWRGDVAEYLCSSWLNPFDDNHC